MNGRDTELRLDIRYRTQPRRGLYFIAPDDAYPLKETHAWTQGQDLDARAWFPCHTDPDDKASSEIVATVPAGMFALSNGELVARRDNGDGSATFHWRENVPHSAYLLSLVAGPFVELADKLDGLPVTYYVLPGREQDGWRALGRTPRMIRFFADRIGVAYPYEKYAQVCVSDFIFGGMENTSATTLTDMFMPDERMLPDYVGDSLVAHELAHQWFGDLVTCREWSHGWLNEGFATYFEAIWLQHAAGEDAFRWDLWQDAQAYMVEDSGRYRRPIVTRTYNEPIDVFDRHLYPKGAWVLHMLRSQLGDESWWRAIKHYVTKHRESTVLTYDLQRAIEEATGRNFDLFFEQWVFSGGHPEFRVSYEWDNERKQARLEVRQTQQLDALTPLFDLPITIRFALSNGVQDHVVRVRDATHSFVFSVAEQPKLVRFDPHGDVLKTLDFARPLELLRYQLRDDPTLWGRIEAAHELAKLGSRAAIESLGEALLAERFWGVQAEIAKALSEARTPAAKQALLRGLELLNSRARRVVVEALAAFRRDQSVADAVWQRFVDGDVSYYVEAEAAHSTGRIKGNAAFERLQEALERPSWNDVVRQHALLGLGELMDERGVACAVEWSAYGKPLFARLGAVAALAKLGKLPARRREVVEHLEALLDDPQLRVREATCRALGQIEDGAALAALERVAGDIDGRVVRLAREALAAIRGASGSTDELQALRRDVDRLSEGNRKLRERLDGLEPAAGGL